MIWPAEADDALTAFRRARNRLGEAEDELHRLRAPIAAVAPFTQAHDAVSWAIEHISEVLTSRTRTEAEAVEERHVDAQICPWMEEDR